MNVTAGNKNIAFESTFLSDVPLQPSQLITLLTQHIFAFEFKLDVMLQY